MPQGDQVKNGKAFEFAIAMEYSKFLNGIGKKILLVENKALSIAANYYNSFSDTERLRFDMSARETINTMLKIEPGLTAQKNDSDVLNIALQDDQKGELGDVRDVIFSRPKIGWEMGFSAKNNNDAVKHSRLSKDIDFGLKWMEIPCSETYWNDITPLFQNLQTIRRSNSNFKWDDFGDDKQNNIYVPLLTSFKKELINIAAHNDCIPEKLISYLIGKFPFYKIIKDDYHNVVIVKAFNINGGLNKTVNKVKSNYPIPEIKLPTRIVEFEFKKGSKDTLNMILDGGWEVSFRIHNASSLVESSLKFDIRLLGNPPVLFTQHLFQ